MLKRFSFIGDGLSHVAFGADGECHRRNDRSAEALPDYEPAQASGELDVDLTTLGSLRVPENSISDCPAAVRYAVMC